MIFEKKIIALQTRGSLWLDIGCGIKKIDNCIGIDKIETHCTDYVHDFEKMGIPFSSSTVDGIMMFEVLGYLDDWVFVMKEMHRVLKPEGTVTINYYPAGKLRLDPYYKKVWYLEMFKMIDGFVVIKEGIGTVTLKATKEYPENFIPVLSQEGNAINCSILSAVRVELGCGWTKRMKPYPFIGVDGYGYDCVDIVKDLERGLPFADDSVDIIFASHFLEHVDNLIGLMEEIYRTLKKGYQVERGQCVGGGILELICPWHESVYAFANPDHKRLIHPGLFGYWGHQTTDMDKEAYNVKAKFEIFHNEHKGDGLFTTLMAIK